MAGSEEWLGKDRGENHHQHRKLFVEQNNGGVDQESAGACVGECWLGRRSIQPWDRIRPDRELLHLLGFYFDENVLL